MGRPRNRRRGQAGEETLIDQRTTIRSTHAIGAEESHGLDQRFGRANSRRGRKSDRWRRTGGQHGDACRASKHGNGRTLAECRGPCRLYGSFDCRAISLGTAGAIAQHGGSGTDSPSALAGGCPTGPLRPLAWQWTQKLLRALDAPLFG